MIFKFNENEIRVVTLEGEPWFVAKDVCEVLEMSLKGGTHQLLSGLDQSEKRRLRRTEVQELFSYTSAPSINAISESGLYKLVLRSNKPDAKAFQDWVTKEVLPRIRKDGMYVRNEEKLGTPEMTLDA